MINVLHMYVRMYIQINTISESYIIIIMVAALINNHHVLVVYIRNLLTYGYMNLHTYISMYMMTTH